MNVNKLATLFLLLTLPAPADAIFSILATIVLFFTGYFDNVCNTAESFFPRNVGCTCSASLTSLILGLIVTGSRVDIDDCSLRGDLGGNPNNGQAVCEGDFEAEGPLISVFTQDFEGTFFGQFDCSVFNNNFADQFTLEVTGEVDFGRTRPELNLLSCRADARRGGISVGQCRCFFNSPTGFCQGDTEVSLSCPGINLEEYCVDMTAIA